LQQACVSFSQLLNEPVLGRHAGFAAVAGFAGEHKVPNFVFSNEAPWNDMIHMWRGHTGVGTIEAMGNAPRNEKLPIQL
jgi:hypothetical protein